LRGAAGQRSSTRGDLPGSGPAASIFSVEVGGGNGMTRAQQTWKCKVPQCGCSGDRLQVFCSALGGAVAE
jgi:hypothetical protein